jgi:hypothetical protein
MTDLIKIVAGIVAVVLFLNLPMPAALVIFPGIPFAWLGWLAVGDIRDWVQERKQKAYEALIDRIAADMAKDEVSAD